MSDNDILEWPQPLGIFSADLFVRGGEYLDAFECIAKFQPNLKFANYFLLSHSLELLLKSYLAARGIDKKLLRAKIGHDLDAALNMCIDFDLPHVSNLEALARHISEMNSNYDFRYPTGFRLSMPRPRDCLPIMQALVEKLEPIITQSHWDAELQFAYETRQHRGKKIVWSD